MDRAILKQLARYPCADLREIIPDDVLKEIAREDAGKSAQALNSNGYKGDLFSQAELQSQQSYQKPVVLEAKIPEIWGLRKQDFRLLNKPTLENIFYGTRNLWVPGEMLDLERPAEIIANYFAAGVLKRYNRHLSDERIPKRSFSKLVKFMNRIAYENPVFAKHSHSFNERTFDNPSQEKRLGVLPGEVKRKFCASFFSRYKASNREEPNNPDAFIDPDTWIAYVNLIYDHFKRRFEKEHPAKD